MEDHRAAVLTSNEPPKAVSSDSAAAELSNAARSALTQDPSRQAIEFEGRWISWGQVRQVAERVCALIAASGARPDAPIAFAPRNRPSAVAALLGLLAAGRTVRMVYAFQSTVGIARDVERSEAALAVFAQEDSSEELLAMLRARGMAAITLGDMDAAAVEGLERSQRPAATIDPAQPQIEILTSGTTGPPKRFAISYAMIARHIVGQNLMYSGGGDPAHATPVLIFFPLGNISGIYSTLPAMLLGLRLVLLERFTVAGWRDHLVRYRPEHSGLPPAGVQMVLDADLPVEELSCIRVLGTGAAPLDPTVQQAFEQRYGVPILLSYGATEFGGPVTAMTPALHAQWGRAKFGSVGRPFAGAKLRVVDPDSNAELPAGAEGLLEVIAPRIGPGWIRTSDIAVIDEDGFLFHRGRADGAIVRGGFKLLPETIERALKLHPAVAAAVVVGLPDPRLGQTPAAAIRLKPGVEPPSVATLEAHLRTHVYATHVPVLWRLVEQLPMTPSMKVDRPAVARLFEPDPPSFA